MRELGLFDPYFVCKFSFRVISIINILTLDQNKPIWLILKIQNRKFKNPEFVYFTFIFIKNGNKTSIQPILKSNSTSSMITNYFCEMNIKKVSHGCEKSGTFLISFWKCNYSIYLDIPVYYLDTQAIST